MVGAFVLPHGGIVLNPTHFSPANVTKQQQAEQLQDACIRAGQVVADLRPDRVLLVTPHGIEDQHAFEFYLNPAAAGFADTDNCSCPPCCYNISVAVDSALSQHLIKRLAPEGYAVSGLAAFGPPGEAGEPAALRWGKVIPLHFIPNATLHKLICSC